MIEVARELCAASGNFAEGRNGCAVEFLFVHYTAGTGSAWENCQYFANNPGLQTSAHYFVDDAEVCRSVADEDTAYAVGNLDMNRRSVSVEVVSAGEDFTADEIVNLSYLVQALMAEHGIPAANVVRHYDAYAVAQVYGYGGGTWVDPGKACPAPYVDDEKWYELWKTITGCAASGGQGDDEMVCIIQPNGSDCLMYFDGQKLHDLTHPDDVTVLDTVYQATHGGASIPVVALGTEESPWASRLYQALYAKPPADDVCPTLRQFEARNPDEE